MCEVGEKAVDDTRCKVERPYPNQHREAARPMDQNEYDRSRDDRHSRTETLPRAALRIKPRSPASSSAVIAEPTMTNTKRVAAGKAASRPGAGCVPTLPEWWQTVATGT